MFKRGKKFTLIELIVVIAVLGILAAIVIPNISNFQNKARDVQLTADTRNIQTALDMYRLNQPDSVSEPILKDGDNEVILTATHELDKDGQLKEISVKIKGTDYTVPEKYYRVLDLEELYPNYLRQIPKYAAVDVDAEVIKNETQAKDLIKFEDGGIVVFATLLEPAVDGSGLPIQSEKSTAIVNALSHVNGELTIVR